ncbi:MAG: hypothetical protein KDJ52_28235 [Anaerolineae bacterium]|nr:hypothetical protein [Anaerolineae bacterium]
MDNIHQTKMATSGLESFETIFQQLRQGVKFGVLLFLLLHLYHLVLISLGPQIFHAFSLNYRQPLPRLVHLVLFFCILFYAIDSLRLVILDLQPDWWRYQRAANFIAVVVFALLFIPTALLILLDTFLPY